MGLYVAGAIAATGMFVRILQEIESVVAQQLRVAQTSRPGALTEKMLASEEFMGVVSGLIGDETLAQELLGVPPTALFYGWVAMMFLPPLVAMTSGDDVSGELATGSARFSLYRTDRTSWAIGRLLGQTMLLGVALALGAAGAFIVGSAGLVSFQWADTGVWLFRLTLRAWVYGFAWLGLVMGVSQCVRTPARARGLAVFMVVCVGGTGLALQADDVVTRWPVLAPTLYQLFPGAHQLELWRPALVHRLSASLALFTIGGVGFWLGHQRLLRMDV